MGAGVKVGRWAGGVWAWVRWVAPGMGSQSVTCSMVESAAGENAAGGGWWWLSKVQQG